MEKSTFNKIWTAVHLAAVGAGVNAILFLQDSPVTLPFFANIQDKSLRGTESLAVFWVYIAGIPLFFSLVLALDYLKNYGRTGAGELSAPVVFDFDLRPGSRLTQCYQAFWLVICMLLSAWGVGHATRIVLKADLYECSVPEGAKGYVFKEDKSILSRLMPRFDGEKVRFSRCSQSDGSTFRRGVVYIPIMNDLLPCLLALLNVGMMFFFWGRWWRLSRRKPEPGATV